VFYVYILYSKSFKRYYIGSTKDINNRLTQHDSGHTPSTKAYRPWIIVYNESFFTLTEARKRKQEIKNWENASFMVDLSPENSYAAKLNFIRQEKPVENFVEKNFIRKYQDVYQ
jgi:putative endonuclease